MTQFADRVKDTTTTTGTGTITLANSAPAGYRTFGAAFAVGATKIGYTIEGQASSEWESGTGTLLTSTTFSRDTAESSSNGNALVIFSAGTKNVFCSLTAKAVVNAGGGSLQVVSTSSLCVSDADLSPNSVTFGTDQRAKLQSILDQAINGPLLVIWDGAYSVGAAANAIDSLLIRSNTTIRALPNCGAILRSSSNVPMFRGANSSNSIITDQDITIEGGTWHGNGANQVHDNATAGAIFLMTFVGIRRLKLRNAKLLYSSTFHFHAANFDDVQCTDVYIDSVRSNTGNTDGLHFGGPGNRLRINGVDSNNLGDDSISVTADDTWNTGQPHGPYLPSYGPITDVEISNLTLTNCWNGVRLLSGGSRLDKVTIRGIKGNTKGYAVVADVGVQGGGTPAVVAAAGAGTYGSVHIEDIQTKNTTGGYLPCVISIDGGYEQLTIANIKRSYFETVEFPTVLFGTYTNITQLGLSGFRSTPKSGGSNYQNQIKFIAGAKVNSLMLHDCDFDGGAAGQYPIRVDAGATITRATLIGNAGSGYPDFISNAGTITTLNAPVASNFMGAAGAVGSTWILAAGFTEQSASGLTFTGPIAQKVNWTKKTTSDAFAGNVRVSAQMAFTGTAGVISFAGAVFARGASTTLSGGASQNGYWLDAVVGSGGNGFRLVKVVNSVATVLSQVGVAAITTYILTLTVKNSTQTGVVQRVSDGFYLNSAGTFVSGAQTAFSFADTAIAAAAGEYGVYGYGDDAGTTETVVFSNFTAIAAP